MMKLFFHNHDHILLRKKKQIIMIISFLVSLLLSACIPQISKNNINTSDSSFFLESDNTKQDHMLPENKDIIKYSSLPDPASVFTDRSNQNTNYIIKTYYPGNSDYAAFHQVGKKNCESDSLYCSWEVGINDGNPSYLSFGPNISLQNGRYDINFHIIIDNISKDDLKIITLDVFDKQNNVVLETKDFSRRDFIREFSEQEFSIPINIANSNNTLEFRIFWHGNSFVRHTRTVITKLANSMQRHILNMSDMPDSVAIKLKNKAIADLGFNNNIKGPQPNDSFFIGNYYIAWIDQTGFYGKMNGLWPVIKTGSGWDFSLKENGRAVNLLIVGENGEGKYGYGFAGADHAEISNYTMDEKVGPGNGSDIKEAYHHNEAFQYPNDTGWWSKCNNGFINYDDFFTPIADVRYTDPSKINSAWILWFEGPIVVGGDTIGTNGITCQNNYLFNDQIRRFVYLRSGYRFYANKPYVDRMYQFRNPGGNPAFGKEIMSVVGGFVLTNYPNTHPLKDFKYLKLEQNSFRYHTFIQSNPQLVLNNANKWYHYENVAYPRGYDDFISWVIGGIFLSVQDETNSKPIFGRSLKISLLGKDNENNGINYGANLGGIETAGGLINATNYTNKEATLQIAGGATSHVGIRRLEIMNPNVYSNLPTACGAGLYLNGSNCQNVGTGYYSPNTDVKRYACTNKPLHATSVTYAFATRVSSNSCPIASVNDCKPGYHPSGGTCAVNPITSCGEGLYLNESICQNVGTGYYSPNTDVKRYACTNKPLHATSVTYAFATRVSSNSCPIASVNTCKSGYHPSGATCEVNSITSCETGKFLIQDKCNNTITYYQDDLNHHIGRKYLTTSWHVNTADDQAGWLSFGPYATYFGNQTITANWYLMIDNNSADNAPIVTIDVYDYTSDTILASKNIYRKEFTATFAAQKFSLTTNLYGRQGHSIEFRTYWHGYSYTRLTRIIVD